MTRVQGPVNAFDSAVRCTYRWPVHRGFGLLLLLSAAAFGCVRAKEQPTARITGVLFYGCSDVTRAGICVVNTESAPALKVWVPGADSSTTAVMLDGEARPTRWTKVSAGARFVLTTTTTGRLTVRQTAASGGVAEWRLRIESRSVPKSLAHAESLRRRGQTDRARAVFEPLLRHDDRSTRGLAMGRMARLELMLGHSDKARALFAKSIDIAQRVGSVGVEIDDRSALAYLEASAGRFAAVDESLAAIERLAAAYPAAADLAKYYRAQVAAKTGDLRRALRLSKDVLTAAERLDLPRFWTSSADIQIMALHRLQRYDEVQSLLRRRWALVPKGPACVRADSLGEAGWLTADVARTQPELDRALDLLEQAQALYAKACRKPRRLAYAQVRLGLLRLQKNELTRAAELLAASKKAPSAGMNLRKARWLLEGEIAIATDEIPRAIEAFARLLALSKRLGDLTMQWYARVGEGRSHERAGRFEAAVESYRAAERILDRAHLQAPMGAGRGGFLRLRSGSAQRLVDLQLRLRRPREAATAARHSRARALLTLAWSASFDAAPDEARRSWYQALFAYRRARASLDAEPSESWGLSKRKLQQRRDATRRTQEMLEGALASLGLWAIAPPAPWSVAADTVLLSYHALPDGEWAAFAVTGSKTYAHRIESLDLAGSKDALARALFAPFASQIRRATRVQIAADDRLAQVGLHALTFDGQPLIWSRPVTYRVDVKSRRSVAQRRERGRALVVAPDFGLPTTLAEARRVADVLREGGWKVTSSIAQPTSRSTLSSALDGQNVDWFHYAGHARLAGIDGWSSALGSAEAPLWTVGDTVSMRLAPRFVVLSACETAAEARSVRFGLGQAFVVAGAEWVIAATRPVLDEHASAMARALYEQLRPKLSDASGQVDPAVALQAAVKQVSARHSKVDWQSFVVLVP